MTVCLSVSMISINGHISAKFGELVDYKTEELIKFSRVGVMVRKVKLGKPFMTQHGSAMLTPQCNK